MVSNFARLLMILPSTLRGGVEEYNPDRCPEGPLPRVGKSMPAFPDRPGTATLNSGTSGTAGIAYHPLEIAENENQLPSVTRQHSPGSFAPWDYLIRLKPDVAPGHPARTGSLYG